MEAVSITDMNKNIYNNVILLFAFPIMLTGFVFPDKHNANHGTMNIMQYDGPYVLYKNDTVLVKYVMNNEGTKIARVDTMAGSEKGSLSLMVATDEPGKTFQVQ